MHCYANEGDRRVNVWALITMFNMRRGEKASVNSGNRETSRAWIADCTHVQTRCRNAGMHAGIQSVKHVYNPQGTFSNKKNTYKLALNYCIGQTLTDGMCPKMVQFLEYYLIIVETMIIKAIWQINFILFYNCVRTQGLHLAERRSPGCQCSASEMRKSWLATLSSGRLNKPVENVHQSNPNATLADTDT